MGQGLEALLGLLLGMELHEKGQSLPLEGALRIYLLDGFGFVKCVLGGIILFSSARADLIMAVSPDAPSEWPTFGLT